MPHHTDSSVRIPLHEATQHTVCIKVIGVGGGGNNAINRMIDLGLDGVQFISVNTDVQSLSSSRAQVQLHIGDRLTHGVGAGADSEVGRKVALDESDKIVDALEGADMVFITAGLGGGTGTGVAPVVASAASQMGALTVAIVTLPFAFEGKRRMDQAKRGLQALLDHVDTLIVIPNDRLLAFAKDTGFFESFRIADDILRQAVQGISDIITVPGVINRDFADVRTTMAGMGYGVMGTASRSGPHRASEAALAAIASPLLSAGAIEGAHGILINIAGSNSLRLSEVHEASMIVQRAAHEDANIIFGTILDERLGAEIKITVIATGFHQESRDRAQRRSLARSVIERPLAYFTNRTRPEIDNEVPPQSLSARHDAREQSYPPKFETIAEFAGDAGLLPETPPDLAAESQKPGEVLDISRKSTLPEDISLSLADTQPKHLSAPPQDTSLVAYEEDLLTHLEGLPFDLNLATNEVVSASKTEIPFQIEIARVRQTALAAYAAMSTREIETTETLAREEASFAEILESRKQMHGSDEIESDRHLDDEEMPNRELAASNGALPQTAQAHNGELVPDSDMPLSHKAGEDRTTQPDFGHDFAESPFIDSIAAPSPTTASSLIETPTTSPVRRNPTPDFNRRLNRKPDFSMGIEVL